MTLHQPWHDGVGRRVGKGLRHIRRPKKPPDPKPSVKKWQHTIQGKKSPGKPAVATISPSIEGLFNLFLRRAVGCRIGGRCWATCAPKHRLSRALHRARYYRSRGRSSDQSQKAQSTERAASMIPFSVQNPHNLSTLSSVKQKRLPPYGLSSTAIAFAITAVTYWLIQRFIQIFSNRKCTQVRRPTSSRRQNRNILSKITTLFFALSSLGFPTLHPGDPFNTEMHQRVPWRSPSYDDDDVMANTPQNAELHQRVPWRLPDVMADTPQNAEMHQRAPWRSAFINTPENAEMHQRVPWRQPFIDEGTYNNIHPPCWDGYKLMVKLDLTVSSKSKVLHSGGTASFS